MRTVLLLCLLSLFACKVDFIETVKCIVSKPKVKEFGLKLFSYIYTKQYSEILPALLKSLPDLYNAVTECLSNPNEDIILKKTDDDKCKHPFLYTLCMLGCDNNPDIFCPKDCFNRNCL